MVNKKKESKFRQKINEIYEQNELANLESNKNRARSITVGTAFGGAVEISMRGDYHNLWTVLQPVEVVEIIEQLASGVGLEIAIRPRQDFATWRGWNVDSENRYWAGAAEWQIEQASTAHKKFLKDEINELNLLTSSEKSKKSNNKKTKVSNTRKKIKKELEIEQQIKEKIHGDSINYLENVRKKAQNKHSQTLEETAEYTENLTKKLNEDINLNDMCNE